MRVFSPLNLVNGILILVILVSLAAVVSSGRVSGPEHLDIGFAVTEV
ncbi:hypothetical protein [Roseivivax sp. THAF40]|nr:hypothetical protein [Roseivivax sp. THAF40]